MKMLSQKVAFITGAGSGIGAAAAKLFAREGARVALISRTLKEVEKVACEISKEDTEDAATLPLQADIGSAEEMATAVDAVRQKWGKLDVVFANAGVNGVWAPLADLKVEEWDETIRINLRGTFLTIKMALPLLQVNGGSVIVTSSVNGTRMFSNAGASAYAATKAGQAALAKMLAVELGKKRIRVNVICPGRIETDIDENTADRAPDDLAPKVEFPEGEIPLTGHRPGSVEQVAELALFLASDVSSHISGAEIFIDGAQSLLQG